MLTVSETTRLHWLALVRMTGTKVSNAKGLLRSYADVTSTCSSEGVFSGTSDKSCALNCSYCTPVTVTV